MIKIVKAEDEKFEVVELDDYRVLFSNLGIDRNSIPENDGRRDSNGRKKAKTYSG